MENGKDKPKASGSSSTAMTPRTAEGQSPAPPKALQVNLKAERYPKKQHSMLHTPPKRGPRNQSNSFLSLQGIQDQMGSLQLDQQGNNPKKSYAFWETQPVAQFNEEAGSSSTSIAVRHGPQD